MIEAKIIDKNEKPLDIEFLVDFMNKQSKKIAKNSTYCLMSKPILQHRPFIVNDGLNLEDEIVSSMSKKMAKDMDDKMMVGMGGTLKVARDRDIFNDVTRFKASMMGMPVIENVNIPKGQFLVMNPHDSRMLINDIDDGDKYEENVKNNNMQLAEIIK